MIRTRVGASVALSFVLLSSSWNAAFAQNANVRSMERWSAEDASGRGFKPVRFEFGSAALSFDTFIPTDATVEFTTHEANGPTGTNVRETRSVIVGKYAIPSPASVIEGTITVYQPGRPGAAATSLCASLIGHLGQSVVLSDEEPDGSRGQFFSDREDQNGDPLRAMFSDCHARGDLLLTQLFAVPIPSPASNAERERVFRAAHERIMPILSNLVFADDRPNGYGETPSRLRLTLGEEALTLPVSGTLAVPFNDFDGRPGPKELYLLDERDGGAIAFVWLGMLDMPVQPDLSQAAPRIVARHLDEQGDDMPGGQLVFNESNEAHVALGIAAAQTFAFALRKSDGTAAGVLNGEAFWHDGRLFVLSHAILETQDESLERVFLRLPALSAYDLLKSAVLNELMP